MLHHLGVPVLYCTLCDLCCAIRAAWSLLNALHGWVVLRPFDSPLAAQDTVDTTASTANKPGQEYTSDPNLIILQSNIRSKHELEYLALDLISPIIISVIWVGIAQLAYFSIWPLLGHMLHQQVNWIIHTSIRGIAIWDLPLDILDIQGVAIVAPVVQRIIGHHPTNVHVPSLRYLIRAPWSRRCLHRVHERNDSEWIALLKMPRPATARCPAVIGKLFLAHRIQELFILDP